MESSPENVISASAEAIQAIVMTVAEARLIMRRFRKMKDHQRDRREQLEYRELLADRQKRMGDKLRESEAIRGVNPSKGFQAPNDVVDEILDVVRDHCRKMKETLSASHPGDKNYVEPEHGAVRIAGDGYESYDKIWFRDWTDHQVDYERMQRSSAGEFTEWCIMEDKAREAEPIVKAADEAKAEEYRLKLKRIRDEGKALLLAREAKKGERRAKA